MLNIIDLIGEGEPSRMDTLVPLAGFVVAAAVTPGPNNLMVLASGANFGLARTMPHILGIAFGFPVMVVAVGIGVAAVFDLYPIFHTILKYLAFAYLLWLAWKIANAGRPRAAGPVGRPLGFLGAAAFQWVNPKGWTMMLGALALFTTADGNKIIEVAAIAVLFGLVIVPNGVIWCLFGRAIAGFLGDDRRRRWFNSAMAVLLVVSVLPTMV